ncbi:D-glycero-alpha-D-manno-heptose-1,7-bisphosphate 7-phosphatase [Kyrpidia spormannii]|uniref:D-glycero-beta-D-manno-heptose-1,7-bisphosphate 7-phosphatase n=1 Tax=Kyrpidia spormannii TaxID=2055160 RepID=A0ACA8Z7N7_9BACL|nr:HAD family hydrolase [Kyrpidia spormannii]CAB3390572.1 D-glycero-beta-D-manno-heptose-1,7-bisphosphate 7-phosphatase [Kyrpidia spormannii]
MRPAVFLDRDGVINPYIAHIHRLGAFPLLPGVGAAVRRLNEAGLWVFVVTNQGGVGLGYMDEKDVRRMHQRMRQRLSAEKARIDAIRFCPHAPRSGCSCRKPAPAMLLDLMQAYPVDRELSFIVGDRESDVEAGHRAGIRAVRIGDGPTRAEFRAPDLPAAVNLILTYHRVKREMKIKR